MPRRTREPSGDKDLNNDRDADSAVKRASKRRRVDASISFTPRRIVDVIQEGDQRLLRKLFRFLQPEQLFALSFTCRAIRSFLRSEHAGAIWKRARKNAPPPLPPRCPPGMSEMAWTELLFVKKCFHCWAKTTRDIDWGLRRRFCSECQKNHVKSQVHMPKTYKSLSEDIFRLVPYSRVARSGVKTQYYWEPELEEVHKKLAYLDKRVAAGKSNAEEQRTRYISDRKRYVGEVLDAVSACEKWQNECKSRRDEAQAELRARVVAKFVELGYAQRDVEEVLRDVTITESSIFGWTNFLRKHRATLDERRPPIVAATAAVDLLRVRYREFLKTRAARGWETLVPFGDITCLPEVKSSLPQLTPDNTAALVKRIPSIVDSWREDVEVGLLKMLPPPPKGVRRVDAYDPQRLTLASSLWRRANDPTPLTYPNMLLVPHLVSLEYGELKYATPEGPWSATGLQYDEVGANVVREFCKFASVNYSTAKTSMLDESALRLRCKLCNDEWPLVLTWRQAIKHLHESHANNGSGSWKPFPSTIDGPIAAIESELPIWVCTVPLCSRSRTQRSMEDMERHLNDKHSVHRPVKGKDYARTLTAPLSEPLNLVELYAELRDDGVYECRTCGCSGSQSSILVHLQKRHDAHLSQIAGVEVAANGSTFPGRGRKRAISVSSTSSHESPPASKRQALFIESTPPAETARPCSTASSDECFANTDEPSSTERFAGTPSVESDADNADSEIRLSDDDEATADAFARLVHVTPRTPPASTTLSANEDRVYVCKRCTRAVDRFRILRLHGLLRHLAARHHIVDPSFKIDYADPDFSADETPDVMPWCSSKVYTCLRCPIQTERFRWVDLDYHLATEHKIVDPVAKLDYDRPVDDTDKAGRIRREPPEVHDQPQPLKNLVRFQELDAGERNHNIATARSHVCRALGIQGFDPDWAAFICLLCTRCTGSKLYGILQHTWYKHGVQTALYGSHFKVSDEEEKNQCDGTVTLQYSCKLCRPSGTSKTFYMTGLLRHMVDQHHRTEDCVRKQDYEPVGSHPNAGGMKQAVTVASTLGGEDFSDDDSDAGGETSPDTKSNSPEAPPSINARADTTITDASLSKAIAEIRSVPSLEKCSMLRPCFMCSVCCDGISYTLRRLFEHFRDCHVTRKPKFERNYELVARAEEAMRLAFTSLSHSKRNTACYLCRQCGVISPMFNLNGVENHLESKHAIKSSFEEHYIDLRSPKAARV